VVERPHSFWLTKHAAEKCAERAISVDDVFRVLEEPLHIEADPERQGIMRAYGFAPSIGNRILRVVYREEGALRVIVTAMPDRNFLKRSK
jgi:uncharacterized DUF497 family protein